MPGQQHDLPATAFVFSGTVAKLNAATIAGIPTGNTIVLNIDQVIAAPAMFNGIHGQQVTVRFNSMPQVAEGSRITVYANGWIYGESLAVDAVSFESETSGTVLSARVQAATAAGEDAEIRQRLNAADAGVVGQVIKIEKSPVPPVYISEHDPNWHEATIQVDEVIKGEPGLKEVKVLFPYSDDIRWYHVHKYKKGQNGIWMLHKGKSSLSATGIPPKVFGAIPDNTGLYTTLHQSDYLSLAELSKVKSLL